MHSIMYIENRGQHASLDTFYKLVTLFDISVGLVVYYIRSNSTNREFIENVSKEFGNEKSFEK